MPTVSEEEVEAAYQETIVRRHADERTVLRFALEAAAKVRESKSPPPPEEIAGLLAGLRANAAFFSKGGWAHTGAQLYLAITAIKQQQRDIAVKSRLLTQQAEEIERLHAWNSVIREKAIDDCLSKIPGGTHCDPQEIADAIRKLKNLP